MTKNLLIVIMMFGTVSCSTMRNSLLTGAGAGAALGAAGGAVTSSKDKGKAAATGALFGAVIGGISSYFIHKGVKKREDKVRRETLFNLGRNNVSMPSGYSPHGGYGHGVSMPMVESEWIETEVKGKKLIEGHRIWMITEDAQWVPSKKVKK